jgi:hypothetical protein
MNEVSALTHHKEIGPGLARAICKQLGVPAPRKAPLIRSVVRQEEKAI